MRRRSGEEGSIRKSLLGTSGGPDHLNPDWDRVEKSIITTVILNVLLSSSEFICGLDSGVYLLVVHDY